MNNLEGNNIKYKYTINALDGTEIYNGYHSNIPELHRYLNININECKYSIFKLIYDTYIIIDETKNEYININEDLILTIIFVERELKPLYKLLLDCLYYVSVVTYRDKAIEINFMFDLMIENFDNSEELVSSTRINLKFNGYIYNNVCFICLDENYNLIISCYGNSGVINHTIVVQDHLNKINSSYSAKDLFDFIKDVKKRYINKYPSTNLDESLLDYEKLDYEKLKKDEEIIEIYKLLTDGMLISISNTNYKIV